MRDSNFSSQRFCSQLDKIITEELIERERTLRSHVSDIPKMNIQFPGLFHLNGIRKLDEICALSLISYWLPEGLGMLLREDLLRMRSRYSLQDQFLIDQFLFLEDWGKSRVLLFLIESNLFHSRDFFGNFLKKGFTALDRLDTYSVSRKKPERTFIRGYRDHGYKSPSHQWLPTSDYSLTKEHYQREREERISHYSFNLSTGMIM